MVGCMHDYGVDCAPRHAGEDVPVHTETLNNPITPCFCCVIPLISSPPTPLQQDGELLAVDPTSHEEVAAVGSLTVIATPQGEVCGAYKTNGTPTTTAQVMRCVRVAASAAEDAVAAIQRALAAHDVARVAARVRRRIPAASLAAKAPEQPVASQLGALDLGAAPVKKKSASVAPSAPEPPTQASVRRRQRHSDDAGQRSKFDHPLPVQPPGAALPDAHAAPSAEAPLTAPGAAEAMETDAVDWYAAAARTKGTSLEDVLAVGTTPHTLAGSVKKQRGRR